MGNGDGDPDNDVRYADGSPVARPVSFEDLHGRYAEDWRVSDPAQSLFTYDAGESLAGFYDPDFPGESRTVSDLEPAVRANAEQAAINAGLQPDTFNFEAAVLDFATTGDASFIESALRATQIDDTAGIGDRLTPNLAEVVAYLYEAALDRDGNIDLPGLNFWIDAREAGFSERDLAQEFLDSPEFIEKFGDANTLTELELTRTLYENVLDRDADQPGLDFWVGQLQQPNFDERDLLLAFAESPENIANSQYIETLNEVGSGDWAFVTG